MNSATPPHNLDFCFDPAYRAPAESFAALEEHLANSQAYDDKLRIESNRLDVISRRLAERVHDLEGISSRGALAAHSYTTHDVFGPVNEASRLGKLGDAQLKHLQAIVSGMNELPREEGPLARGINSYGDKARRDLIAGHYEVGQITVETALTSFSMTSPDAPDAAVPGDIDLRIESKTARRLQEIASVASEREAVLLPGSQLLVHSKELVSELNDEGEIVEKVVIHAEEIAPGDPRYLDRAEVDQRIADRCERARAEVPGKSNILAQLDPESLHKDQEPATDTGGATEPAQPDDRNGSTTDADSVAPDSRSPQQPPVVEGGAESGGSTDSSPEPPQPSKIENVLDGSQLPEDVYEGAQDLPGPDSADPYGAPPLPVDADGNPAWNQLAGSTPPVTERAALHAGTAHPEHQAAYVADRHPELGAVNPDVGQPDAYDRGFLTNCTRCVVGYAQRLAGIDVRAEPVLPGELATKGRLDYIDQRLGGEWESHGSYDSIIDRMSREPIGSHAVIGVQYMNGAVPLGHVAMVTNTPDGVAFIDPQTGRLMTLPHPPRSLTLLPFGSLPQDGVDAGSARGEPGGQESDSARRESSSDVSSEQSEPELRRETAEPDEEASRSRRPDGPWFGEHTNPFRPSFPGEEEEDEAGLPRGEPISRPPEGIRPPGTSSGMEQADRPTPSAPGPQPGPAAQPDLPVAPVASGPIGSPAVPDPPNAPAAEDAGALNRSFSGLLDPLLPETSHAPAPAAPGMSSHSAENTPSGSSRSAEQGVPASAPPPQGAPAGDAVASGPDSQRGSAGGIASGSQGTTGGVPGGVPGGGPGAGGAGPGSGSARQPWRAGAASGISYEREQAIPPELVPKYLGNHEPSELLAGDGRQSLFRSTSLPDLGPGGLDEFSAGEHAVKLRCEVASGLNPGVLPDQGGLGGGEFTGNAEIVLEDLSGTERVLGTYDSNTQSWTPTPAGRSWMNDPDGNLPSSEQRRTP